MFNVKVLVCPGKKAHMDSLHLGPLIISMFHSCLQEFRLWQEQDLALFFNGRQSIATGKESTVSRLALKQKLVLDLQSLSNFTPISTDKI